MRIVQSMVDQLGGALTIRGRPGATFEIRLPAAAVQPDEAEESLL
jgi:signal transduction histidine kinase